MRRAPLAASRTAADGDVCERMPMALKRQVRSGGPDTVPPRREYQCGHVKAIQESVFDPCVRILNEESVPSEPCIVSGSDSLAELIGHRGPFCTNTRVENHEMSGQADKTKAFAASNGVAGTILAFLAYITINTATTTNHHSNVNSLCLRTYHWRAWYRELQHARKFLVPLRLNL
jgi:hypothetical protein